MSQDEYNGLKEMECQLGNVLKDDFIDTMINHYGLNSVDASIFWSRVGDKYSSRIFDHITDEISNIVDEDTRRTE